MVKLRSLGKTGCVFCILLFAFHLIADVVSVQLSSECECVTDCPSRPTLQPKWHVTGM